MKKIFKNQSTKLLVFLAIFSFSISLFDNYRELWLKANEIPTISISKVITIASIVTALCLFFFSLKVPPKRLKNGVTVTILLKLITSTLLILFDGTGKDFFIKIVTFFDIAFIKIIASSIYPLMLNFQKSDELYTKREVVESLANKFGLFLASYLLGKCVGSLVIDYNKCLLLSVIFTFISFVIILSIKIDGKGDKVANLKESFQYFNKNSIIYLFLIMSFFSSMTWSSLLGLKMLSLTETIGLSAKNASYLVLVTGILTNVLAMLIVKYLKFKNDYLNILFKFGLRLIFYLLIVLLDSPIALLVAFVYLLLTDVTYNFVFSGFIINTLDEKYVLIYNVVKYSISLIANGIGAFICGLTFNLEIKYIGLTTLILGIITYVLSNILVHKKNLLVNNSKVQST